MPAHGEKGDTGNGISSIQLTSSKGNVDIYTITYTDGTKTVFTITNGEDGEQGIQGVPGKDGHTPVITIGSDGYWYIDGISTSIHAQGEKGDKGDKGDKGNGITSITKTQSVGNVDIYTILYEDGTSNIFTVTNGEDGEQGIQGVPGKDGHTPAITIGENGNWYVDGEDTNVLARGEKGDTGNGIKNITTHYETDENGHTYIVFTFYFTDENFDPVVQKILLEKKIVNGGKLTDTEYLLLNEDEDVYTFNIMVGYDDCSTEIVELDTKYITNNNVDFYTPGVYELEYVFLGEIYNYDIVVISKEAKEYRDNLIEEIEYRFSSIKNAGIVEKLTYDQLIDELYKTVDVIEMDKMYENILNYLIEIGYKNIFRRPFDVNAKIEINFFNVNDPQEIQDQSIIYYNGMYKPSTGIEYSYNNEQFSVFASESGTVTEVQVDSLYGTMVYVKSLSGYTFIYGSLDNVQVSVGNVVKIGDLIGVAGTNTINESLANHLHFAIMEDSKMVDPEDYFA